MHGTSEDKRKGAFWGLAVGDALGMPVEFMDRGTFPPIDRMHGGGYFRLPAGGWTDDTAMALCLAESLAAHPELNPADLIARFRRWIEHGENSSTGRSVGLGQNTMRVLFHHFRHGTEYAPPVTSCRADGNGAIMRLAPVACLHWRESDRAKALAAKQSRITHHSAKSEAACEYLCELLCRLIAGAAWDEALAIPTHPDWPEEIQAIANGAWQTKQEPDIQSTGYVVHTLEAALWAVYSTESFRDALIRAVNLGDDADTVAAVTGQIAGARYGYSAIPPEWLGALAKPELLESVFGALAKEKMAA